MKQPFAITVGHTYRYTSADPPGCKGGLYLVEDLGLSVPAYQEAVHVLCVEGKDKGRRFNCTPWNFFTRYEPLPAVVPLEKVAGYNQQGVG